MATRRQIRDAFYTELVDSVSGSIAADDVTLQDAEDIETLPQVIYNDNYRRVTYNGVGTGPHVVNRDSTGAVTDQRWRKYIEAQFLVELRDSDEISKEAIYENLYSHFGAYTMPGFGIINDTHPKHLHADVIDVELGGANSNDALGEEDPIRADSFEVRVEFFREYELVAGTDMAIITQINLEVDADLDPATTGLTYTIT